MDCCGGFSLFSIVTFSTVSCIDRLIWGFLVSCNVFMFAVFNVMHHKWISCGIIKLFEFETGKKRMTSAEVVHMPVFQDGLEICLQKKNDKCWSSAYACVSGRSGDLSAEEVATGAGSRQSQVGGGGLGGSFVPLSLWQQELGEPSEAPGVSGLTAEASGRPVQHCCRLCQPGLFVSLLNV